MVAARPVSCPVVAGRERELDLLGRRLDETAAVPDRPLTEAFLGPTSGDVRRSRWTAPDLYVELRGIEPLASTVRLSRSTN